MPDEMSADEYTAMQAKQAKRGKYNNERVEVDKIQFDSLAEAHRYADLRHLERAGEIRDLEPHPRFPLTAHGVKLGVYVGDFRYVDVATGRVVIEDVKSPISITPVYRWKKRHVKAQYGLEIVEVAA